MNTQNNHGNTSFTLEPEKTTTKKAEFCIFIVKKYKIGYRKNRQYMGYAFEFIHQIIF